MGEFIKKFEKWVENNKPVVVITGGLFIALVLIIIASSLQNQQDLFNKSVGQTDSPENKINIETSTPVPSPAPKPDTSELNATVKLSYDVPGIEITNNESIPWDTCKLKLNDDWSRELNNPLSPAEPLNNPYGLFTKSDGERFNILLNQPKSVSIACEVNGTKRYNYFVFK